MHSWRFMLHTFSCWRTRSGPPGVTPPARSRRGRANKALLYLAAAHGAGDVSDAGPACKVAAGDAETKRGEASQRPGSQINQER